MNGSGYSDITLSIDVNLVMLTEVRVFAAKDTEEHAV